jgi:hypothetical protein
MYHLIEARLAWDSNLVGESIEHVGHVMRQAELFLRVSG